MSDLALSISTTQEHTSQRSLITCVEEASPFIVPLFYLVGGVNKRLDKEMRTNETRAQVEMLDSVVGKFDSRWKAAGAYSKVVTARKMMIS